MSIAFFHFTELRLYKSDKLGDSSKWVKKSQERNKFFQIRKQKPNKCFKAQLEIKICNQCFLSFILGICSEDLIEFLLPDELKFNSVPLEALIQNKLLASVVSHLNYILRERTVWGT